MHSRQQQHFAIRLSLAIGFLMLAGKWFAYGITGSSAILSDAAESVVHILGVALAAFSVWLSLQPADASHPYGHDRISFFSAGFEGFLIITAAFYICWEAVNDLVAGVEVRQLDTGIIIIACASLLNLALGWYLVRTGRSTHSIILVANGKHVLTDSWTSFGVVGGLLLTLWTGWLPLDPLIAIVVALNIIWSGGKLIRQSVGGLMDEGDPKVMGTITSILSRECAERSLRYHEVRYRTSGTAIWVEFHLLFPPGTKLEDAHHHATEIESMITGALPLPARVTSHLETADRHDEIHEGSLKH